MKIFTAILRALGLQRITKPRYPAVEATLALLDNKNQGFESQRLDHYIGPLNEPLKRADFAEVGLEKRARQRDEALRYDTLEPVE